MKVAHVITGLQMGGAEVMLARLLGAMDRDRFEPAVLGLGGPGPVGDQIAALGVPVETLGLTAGPSLPRRLLRLSGWLRAVRPDLVQTWLYHADLLGGLAGRLTGSAPIVWGVHSSNLQPGIVKPRTIRVARACAQMSTWLPAAVVCCSESTRDLHRKIGYQADRLVVIPNGFDLDTFRPDPAARSSVREELGIEPDAPLVGMIARFDPQKDHQTFVRAAARVAAVDESVRYLLCGDGVTPGNPELRAWLGAAGIADRCRLLGRRSDTVRLQASLDVGTLSSVAVEALPLVIGEAMACGVPCAVTDVGDSALLVGDTGRVVPPGDADALARAWLELLSLGEDERRRLGLRARQRIADHYSLDRTAGRYSALYDELGATRCAA